MDINKIRQFVERNKLVVQNFSYVSILEIFVLISPLITYPYLVKVLGKEIYGVILTATALSQYASVIINFGSNSICAKHVSINRDNSYKLSELLCNVFFVKFIFWCFSFFVYLIVVFVVPGYRNYLFLFIVTYGLTIYDLLFPQYFFQGIEKMKYSTMISICIKLFFISLIFIFVKTQSDYFFVPIFYSVGYILAGIASIYIIFIKMKISFVRPKFESMLFYVKDSLPIFATELIKTIKDKLSILILGGMIGMSNVPVYDFGSKICNLMAKPVSVIGVVLFPRLAKTHDANEFKKLLKYVILLMLIVILVVNIFLPYIVLFFLKECDDLLPIRLFSIAPFFLAIGSFINSNLCVAFGYNRYVLYSIIITTIVYLALLLTLMLTGSLTSIYAFIFLALTAYIIEFLYRCYVCCKILKLEKIR